MSANWTAEANLPGWAELQAHWVFPRRGLRGGIPILSGALLCREGSQAQDLQQGGCHFLLQAGVLGNGSTCWASACSIELSLFAKAPPATGRCYWQVGFQMASVSHQPRTTTSSGFCMREGLTSEGPTDDAHHKGLSQHILELSPWHSFVPTAHSPPCGQVLTAEEMSNRAGSCRSDFWQAALKAADDMLGKLAVCEQLEQFGHWSKWQHLQGAALHLQPLHCHQLVASKNRATPYHEV
ncbi:MAG: hypothetical protein FRX49_11359 [Trebouxia sp. A1-2]|nr:MAG: hypothetical protein FRX49_11359 [Trebouxia sp. A1-2]